jgi:putative DNA primase/helicase
VTTATASYRHEQDMLGDFIEDCCILESTASISKADLKDEYERWCKENNADPITQRAFKARLTEKGITEGRNGKERYWRGIRLRAEADSKISGDKSDNTLPHLASEVTRVTEDSVKSLYKEKQGDFIENPVTFVTDVTDSEMTEFLPTAGDDARDTLKGDDTEYPTQPCYICGCIDYWLTDWNQWLCSRCHPKPGGK